MIETTVVTFLVILAFAAALSVGQWFGRAPISGKCSPDNPECCMSGNRKECGESNG